MKTILTPSKRKWTDLEAVFFSNQSNGRGTSLLADFPVQWQVPSNFLKEYNFGTGLLTPVQAGTNRSCFLATRPADTGLTGPIAVAQQYLSYLNKNLYCVNMTRGGSGLYPYASSYFNYSTAGAQGARAYAQAALGPSQSDHSFLIIWSGENEAELPNGDPGIAGFLPALVQEINDFREMARATKGPEHKVSVIIMLVHNYAAAINANAIRAAQTAAAWQVGQARTIDTNFVNQSSVHFNYTDYVLIMKKISRAMGEMRSLVFSNNA